MPTLESELEFILDEEKRVKYFEPEKYDEKTFQQLRDKVLTAHLERDQYSRDFLEGKLRYTELIKPIQEKYGTWWKRMKKPKQDNQFDKKVKKLEKSMDLVGVSYGFWACRYTTKGVREYRKHANKFNVAGLGVGLAISTIAGAGMCFKGQGDIGGYAFMATMPIAIYSIARVFSEIGTTLGKEDLDQLAKDAKDTEKFLTEAYRDYRG